MLAKYNESEAITLPPSFECNDYLFVVSDSGDVVFEDTSRAQSTGQARTCSKSLRRRMPISSCHRSTRTVRAGVGRRCPFHGPCSTRALARRIRASGPIPLVWRPMRRVNTLSISSAHSITKACSVSAAAIRTTRTSIFPDYLSTGTYYVVVTTGGPKIYLREQRHTLSGPIHVTFTPPPVLDVTTVSGPPTGVSGDYSDVSWTVQNIGSGNASAMTLGTTISN